MHYSTACVHCKSFARHLQTPQNTPNITKRETHKRISKVSQFPDLAFPHVSLPARRQGPTRNLASLPKLTFSRIFYSKYNPEQSPPVAGYPHSQPSQPQKHHIWPGASKTLRPPHLLLFHPPSTERQVSQVRNLPNRAIYNTYVRRSLHASPAPDLVAIQRWSGEGSLLKEGDYEICGLLEGPGTGFPRGR